MLTQYIFLNKVFYTYCTLGSRWAVRRGPTANLCPVGPNGLIRPCLLPILLYSSLFNIPLKKSSYYSRLLKCISTHRVAISQTLTHGPLFSGAFNYMFTCYSWSSADDPEVRKWTLNWIIAWDLLVDSCSRVQIKNAKIQHVYMSHLRLTIWDKFFPLFLFL